MLLVGQPTRGVDIGAIEFIQRQLIAMREAGKAILLVSVELDEVRALSDRVLVMCGGRIVGESSPETDEREIGLMMAGMGEAASPSSADALRSTPHPSAPQPPSPTRGEGHASGNTPRP